MTKKTMSDAKEVHSEFEDDFAGEEAANVTTEFKTELEKLIRKLKQREEDKPTGEPGQEIVEVKLDDLQFNLALFQPRKLEKGKHLEDHVRELRQGFLVHKRFDPVVVLAIGAGKYVVVDGHHRVEALRLINRERSDRRGDEDGDAENVSISTIEAKVWTGNVLGAVIYARAINSKATRSLAAWERSEAAWQMVLTGLFSNREITKATNVSLRTVKVMNSVLRKGGPRMAQLDPRSNRFLDADFCGEAAFRAS